MYYIYVLESLKDKKFYIGYTNNLKVRVDNHNKGLVKSTKFRAPFKLVYFEGCLHQQDATKREKYIKTFYGKIFLRKRLGFYLSFCEKNKF